MKSEYSRQSNLFSNSRYFLWTEGEAKMVNKRFDIQAIIRPLEQTAAISIN